MTILCKVKFLPDGKEISISKKTDLLSAAIKAGVGIYNSCGGRGICGKCRVILKTGNVDTDTSILTDEEKQKGCLLACRTFCKTDADIFIPEESRVGKAEILIRGEKVFTPAGLEIKKIAAGKAKYDNLGVAVDIGTTTLVVYIVDLSGGGVVCAKAMYNPQISFGEDVITRMIFAEDESGNKRLHSAVINGINNLIKNCLREKNISADNINSLVAAGNTTMIHTLFGLNPSYIRKIPYTPKMDFLPSVPASKLSIKANKKAVLRGLPSVSAYVGGDIVAGVLACGMQKSDDVTLFVDLGTNGEVVFGSKEFLVCCSTSAGPCFEGGGIKWGMRAQAGAIEKLKIKNKKLQIETIGNKEPVGICGAGIISIIAELFLKGIIDKSGEFVKGSSEFLKETEDGPEFFITGNISITRADIKNLIHSKGAVFSGCEILVKKMGFDFSRLSRIIIAGGLGNALDIEKSIILGLFPDLPMEKFKFIGNASVTGAKMCLLSEENFDEAKRVASSMTYIDLSTDSEFMNNYTASLFLPHTNSELFPSLKRRLKD